MRKKIFNMIWVMGVLALAVFCLSACDNKLDIQTAYPFKLETMPIPGRVAKGQTVEIRCTLVRQGRFADTRYSIRYFQYDGTGVLRMDDGTVFNPNDRYPLKREMFRLYYTSATTDAQKLTITVESSDGQVQELELSFNNDTKKDESGGQGTSSREDERHFGGRR